MFDDFTSLQEQRWTQTCIGNGSIQIVDSAIRMGFESAQHGKYTDAQIDDYAGKARSTFPWQPPLRMEVRARSSLPAATATSTSESTDILRGTAGFGFWNYPFSIKGQVLMLPESVWFFYASPPSNMALVPGMHGWGWKAQVVHSMRLDALFATVPMAMATTWSWVTGEIGPAARWMQRLTGAHEAIVPGDMTNWHTYVLEWRRTEALFWVDNKPLLRAPQPPTRPLGFIAWLDNQYAIATPRGIVRFGAISSGPQWFEMDSVKIEPL